MLVILIEKVEMWLVMAKLDNITLGFGRIDS
jgi:hypothetical protein